MSLEWDVKKIKTRSGGRVIAFDNLSACSPITGDELYEVITLTDRGFRKYIVDSDGAVNPGSWVMHDDDIVPKNLPVLEVSDVN